jgi:hypothetical protein
VELKNLRKGLGIEQTFLASRVMGPELRRVCQIVDGDSPARVRNKVITTVERLIELLPAGMRTTARILFGFDNPASQLYTSRLAGLAQQAQRDVRTMQRRADEILYRLAELACLEPAPVRPEPPAPMAMPWHTKELQVNFVLKGTKVEVFETRRIVSHVPDLQEIEHSISLVHPARPDGPIDLAELGIDDIQGGEVYHPRMVSASRVAFTMRLHWVLNPGDEHEFLFRVQVDASAMAPFYCCTPEFACERFTLNLRFGRDRIPLRAWLIDGELSMAAQDPTPERKPLPVTGAGEVRYDFVNLQPARSYGIGWEPG